MDAVLRIPCLEMAGVPFEDHKRHLTQRLIDAGAPIQFKPIYVNDEGRWVDDDVILQGDISMQPDPLKKWLIYTWKEDLK